MIVEDLRKSILESAIRGNLVANNTNENIIDVEIKHMNDKYDGKEEINKTPDFTIPKSWRWVKLDNISYSNIGLTYKPSDISTEGIPVFRSNNIKDGKIIYDDLNYVNIEVNKNKMCNPGDILMCSRNGSKRLVGKCAIIEEEGYSFGAFMAIIRSDVNEYLYYVFNSPYFRKKMLGDASTTTINQITQKMLANFWLPLPPIEEQRRIVSKLKMIFEHLQETQEIENRLNQLKQIFPNSFKESILFNYVMGLRSTNKKPINEYYKIELPDNWKWEKFENLTTCRMGKTILAKDLIDNGIPVYSATNSDSIFGFVKESDLILKKGDIVIPARGNSIGCATYIENEIATCTQTTIACQPNDKIDHKYLYYCCYALKKVWFKYTGSAIPQITISNINKNFVPLPPLNEQIEIVKQIEKLLPIIKDIEKIC